ncbi:hypothetical protein [uncultured Ruegeria sp.]|uniref:hypothetical protein n=1 Tax=uncultured Ruegeria sp. TaxID=259304 RepID=UPI00260BCBF3|nr:hypothetical protein [uncultured Ruegeria sp.]
MGSIRKGKVIALSEDGSVRTIVEDERLRSAVVIRVDEARNRLLVNSSDYGVAERSEPSDKFATMALGVYDLDTGEPVLFVNLAGLRPDEAHFANDLAVDDAGNAYITDSLAAAIYKVTPAGQASVFLTHEDFRGSGFNLNGIQVHPDGYLLVAKKSDGSLFKVPLDRPAEFSRVATPKPLVGTDGLLLVDADTLVVITNLASGVESNTVFSLSTSDDWGSANIEGQFETGDVYPTTGTIKDGKVFVNYGRLNTLGATLGNNGALLEGFTIQEVGQLKQ